MIIAMRVPGLMAEVIKPPTNVDGLDLHMLSGVVPVVAVVGLLVVALLVWAIFLRHRPRNPRERLLTEEAPSSGRRRRRHRRREHRPTNPTLAETGGLPPIKSDPSRDDPA